MALPMPTINRYRGQWAVNFAYGFCVCESEAEARELLAVKTAEADIENARPSRAPTAVRMDPRYASKHHRASQGRR